MKKFCYFLIFVSTFVAIWRFSSVSGTEKGYLKYENKILDLNDEIQCESENVEIYLNSEGILSRNEQTFLNKINEIRKENGLKELVIDDNLQNVARLKALDMVENDYLSHESLKYGKLQDMLLKYCISYKKANENIVKTQNISSAITLLMESEQHKSNILNNEFNYTGLAVSKNYTGSKVFVEIFIKK